MKVIKVLFLCFIFSAFFCGNSNAQAIVIKDDIWTLGDYESIDAHEVYTPSGCMNLSATFQLDKDDPLVPQKGEGTIKRYVGAWIYFMGEWYLTTGILRINPSGKVKAKLFWRPGE